MIPQSPPAHRALLSTIGAAGMAATLLLFGAQGFLQAGGAEPAFDADAAEIQTFFDTRGPELFSAGAYVSLLGLVAFLWFLGGVHALLRHSEEPQAWRSAIALVSGVVFVSTVITSGWELAAIRVEDGLDPQLARFAFDMGNLWFATSWMALGSFALATGWVILSSRVLPHWLGWWAVIAGTGLVAARAVWTTPLWFFPYALFWLWVIALSVRCLRRRTSARA
ncbi:hypothetical protein [Planotetraspora kaengkrachanensis]|uniref:DUF4386 family protein n=1 Tax=Planotetraspora kaengkrachanensis TaxID=575193 RepID=A0A8J3PWN4_9ACTN|nr:hypothetical protein [Planotetraspora kaengkrachanensis]GIG82281.1 hypothetical protein Pka01_54080 [Planotetraspora kaengkrachanensis]